MDTEEKAIKEVLVGSIQKATDEAQEGLDRAKQKAFQKTSLGMQGMVYQETIAAREAGATDVCSSKASQGTSDIDITMKWTG